MPVLDVQNANTQRAALKQLGPKIVRRSSNNPNSSSSNICFVAWFVTTIPIREFERRYTLLMKGLRVIVAYLAVILPTGFALLSAKCSVGVVVDVKHSTYGRHGVSSTSALRMAQVSQEEAKKGIDKVVNTLKRDPTANQELGKLEKVTTVLGYGSPTPGSLAVRFNASFKKGGFGRSAIPLPFGLGQSEKTEGRGQMVGQVKASIDMKTGKVTSCSVFRDLGYGRAFNLKV